MQIFNAKTALKDYLRSVKTKKSSIGFVPTMGALHEGHQSLIAQSTQENDITVVSIFVNPTQFNNPEDLEKYPRTLDDDIKKIADINPNGIVFAPTVDDMYEGKTISQSFDFDGLENKMEGKFRPGHFDGVGTIVKLLFEIVEPTKAYFGEKDFQQVQIVKKMVAKNHLPLTIVVCPILRETSGLAMSSRNERLPLQKRKDASLIYKILKEAKEKFKNNSAQKTTQWVKNEFDKNKEFTLEYFEIADEDTLSTCNKKIKNKKYRAFIAVFIDNVRLIDTISLN
ncbi:pantoate--beta-alanine ligase [Flavobacterium sp.]|uniref:pantoate--beta-alanine ligase n=1 Tax=Flavobacterium sp. TaxID=239 RepID=UPI002C8041FD|nr:pantoate--beta-alanine ligase [Flavobacterium sp.]HSD06100.1 pantoate--beta-alanine ligase [Flavobacterium sp.]